MKNLNTLIKLHRSYVDSTLKEMARLNSTKELMEKRLVEIESAMSEEAQKFTATEFGFVLDSYLVGARVTISKLAENIRGLDVKILESQVILHDQFSELKKFEIALQNRQNAERDAENMEEIKAIDEMNIMRMA